MIKLEYTEEALNKLIDKALEYRLNKEQKNNIKKLINALLKNPFIGNKLDEFDFLPIKTDYSIERHIGNNIFIIFHYDIKEENNNINIIIRSLYLGYKF